MTDFPVTPDPNRVLIIDVSKWQDDPNTPQGINFSVMRAMGCSGVIMKVGQGFLADRAYQLSSSGAKLAELPQGGYWYYDNRIDPRKQAEMFSETVGNNNVELGFWLDLEDRQQGMYKGWKNWYNFLTRFQELRPNSLIGIYTGHYYWVEYTAGSGIPKASLDYFKKFPLWIAAYGSDPLPTAPWGSDWKIWQFTDLLDAKKYGAESIELDGNYFNSTLNYYEFFKLGTVQPPVTPPPTGEIMPEYTMTPIWNGTRIRSDHNTYATVIESRNTGDLIKGNLVWVAPTSGNEVNAGDKWLYVTHVNGVELVKKGWMAYIHKSIAYCSNFKEVGVVTPPPVDPPAVTLKHTIEVYSDGSIKIDGQPY